MLTCTKLVWQLTVVNKGLFSDVRRSARKIWNFQFKVKETSVDFFYPGTQLWDLCSSLSSLVFFWCQMLKENYCAVKYEILACFRFHFLIPICIVDCWVSFLVWIQKSTQNLSMATHCISSFVKVFSHHCFLSLQLSINIFSPLS